MKHTLAGMRPTVIIAVRGVARFVHRNAIIFSRANVTPQISSIIYIIYIIYIINTRYKV